MSANTIRNVLGVLQDDPDRPEAWARLREALGVNEAGTDFSLLMKQPTLRVNGKLFAMERCGCLISGPT